SATRAPCGSVIRKECQSRSVWFHPLARQSRSPAGMSPAIISRMEIIVLASGLLQPFAGTLRRPAHLRSHDNSDGMEVPTTIRDDLLDEAALARLPDAPNVMFMAGRKFGSLGDEPLTWAMNTHVPALVCRRYPRSRIVAFSTGNVYGLTRRGRGGSSEEDPP